MLIKKRKLTLIKMLRYKLETAFSARHFKVLWFDDYYDGMLCGILEYKNEKYRFEIISDITNNNLTAFSAIQYMECS